MENELARDLTLAGAKIQYDAQCKRVLSEKEILAWILQNVAAEFSEMSIKEIVNCIEGEAEISSVRVNPGGTNREELVPGKISGTGTEDRIPDEGVVYYDIRFFAMLPREEGKIKIIINLEAQKTFYPGYEIVTRGVFYGARMISAQLGTEFEIPDYDSIKKVYSIWICMNAPNYIGNAIAVYPIVKKDFVPGIPDKPKAYDKLSVVLICLNEKKKRDNELLKLLNHLLSPNETAEAKKEILEKQFYIGMENNLGREINIMCNLSDYVEERGIQKGEANKMRDLVVKKLDKGQSVEQIADALEESVETIRKIIEEVTEVVS